MPAFVRHRNASKERDEALKKADKDEAKLLKQKQKRIQENMADAKKWKEQAIAVDAKLR